jgi:hypothetical protein
MNTLKEIAAMRQKCDELRLEEQLQQFRHIWLAERVDK